MPDETADRRGPSETGRGPEVAPQPDELSGPARKGMLVVYYGPGHGPSAAATGAVFRAWGREMPVQMFEMAGGLRSEPSDTYRIGEMLGIPVSAGAGGESGAVADENWRAARGALVTLTSGLVVLSDLSWAVREGLLDRDDVLDGLRGKAGQLHVILTGEEALPEIVEIADLVTDMRMLKRSAGR